MLPSVFSCLIPPNYACSLPFDPCLFSIYGYLNFLIAVYVILIVSCRSSRSPDHLHALAFDIK